MFNKIVKLSLFLVFLVLLFSVLQVLMFKWINPPISAMMAEKKLGAILGDKKAQLKYQWVNYDEISPNMKLAVIASEDQKFPEHWGLDIEAIQKAQIHNKKSKHIRGASTISQQVAKNLFLWSDRSYLRKGLEAYYTLLIELVWDKERILEIYLNIAEMGDMIYGVEMASQHYFKRPAKALTKSQSALLAAILPNPIKYSVKKPSNYILRKRNWILKQMNSLGGNSYLNDL